MFVRESPDDQCTIINIVANDCICSDVFKGTLVLYVAFSFCRKMLYQRPGPFKIMRKFKETIPKNNCNILVTECEKKTTSVNRKY